MRVDSASDFVWAFERLAGLLTAPDVRIERDDAHGHALVESFIPGSEYAVEGVLTEGVFRAFAIFDKPDPLDGPFFEETIYVTPSRAPLVIRQAIVDGGSRGGAGARTPPRADSCRMPCERRRVCTCSRSRHVRSAACGSRAALRRSRTAFESRSKRCCFDTRSVRTSCVVRASSDASGVMMIPDPQARRVSRRPWVNDAARC